MKTFYIGSNSHPNSISRVRDWATRLESLGLKWEFDWTQVANQEHRSLAETRDNIRQDLDGVANCDLFVFLNYPEISRGAYIEVGYRLAQNRPVHYIDNHVGELDYFFHDHFLVWKWKTPSDLLEAYKCTNSSLV